MITSGTATEVAKRPKKRKETAEPSTRPAKKTAAPRGDCGGRLTHLGHSRGIPSLSHFGGGSRSRSDWSFSTPGPGCNAFSNSPRHGVFSVQCPPRTVSRGRGGQEALRSTVVLGVEHQCQRPLQKFLGCTGAPRAFSAAAGQHLCQEAHPWRADAKCLSLLGIYHGLFR